MALTTWLGLLRSLVIYHNPVRTGPLRRFYRDLLRPGDLVFDVGAHVGTRRHRHRRRGKGRGAGTAGTFLDISAPDPAA